MAKPPIRIRRSAVSGSVPTTAQLALGELAINTADGKIFLKKDDGSESIVEIGASGGTYTSPKILSLYEKTDSGTLDSFDGVETRFQLRDSTGAVATVENALYLAVSINGVVQKPNTGTPSSPFEGFYITANATLGTDIVFSDAPATGADSFIVLAGTFSATSGTSAIKILDDISSQFDGIETDFTLAFNGSTYTPEFPNAIIVNIGGVAQVPTDAYSISGSTISFTSAPPAGASFYALSLEIGEAVSGLPTTGGTLSGNLTLSNQSDLRFGDSDNTNWVGFQAPSTVLSNILWTLPAADGTSGQLLSTNGSGTLSWVDDIGVLVTDGGNFNNGTSTLSTAQILDGGQF